MATLLFLHGLAGHGGEWDAVARELATDHSCLMPDLRGHNPAAKAPASLEGSDFVADLVPLLESSGRPNVVIGQSMGGIVATHLASARPDLVDGLVMVEAGVDALSPDTLRDVTAWLATWPSVFADEGAASNFFGVDRATTPVWVAGLVPKGEALAPRFETDALVQIMERIAVPDRWDMWRALPQPRLIVRGAQGSLTADHADLMAAAGEAITACVEEAGHDVHLDQPGALASLIADFAASLSA